MPGRAPVCREQRLVYLGTKVGRSVFPPNFLVFFFFFYQGAGGAKWAAPVNTKNPSIISDQIRFLDLSPGFFSGITQRPALRRTPRRAGPISPPTSRLLTPHHRPGPPFHSWLLVWVRIQVALARALPSSISPDPYFHLWEQDQVIQRSGLAPPHDTPPPHQAETSSLSPIKRTALVSGIESRRMRTGLTWGLTRAAVESEHHPLFSLLSSWLSSQVYASPQRLPTSPLRRFAPHIVLITFQL